MLMVAKPAGGVFTPVEAKDPVVELAQTLGVIVHARIVSTFVYPIKKGVLLKVDLVQSIDFVHNTETVKVIALGKVSWAEGIEVSLNPKVKV